MPSELSFLDVVELCDNKHIHLRGRAKSGFDNEKLIPFCLAPDSLVTIGLLRPSIVEALTLESEIIDYARDKSRMSFKTSIDTHIKRTAAMKDLCERYRDSGLFDDVCGPKKWRNENYAVYKQVFSRHDYPDEQSSESDLNFAFEMERSACALFGIVTYGVHMNVFQQMEKDGKRDLLIWVPTRAYTKPTFPGMLVAGGIPSGMSHFDSMIKECMEEASLQPDLVKKFARSVGAISYFYQTSKGWLQPEIEYCYDLEVPAGMDPEDYKPEPSDGEVESFQLMTLEEVTSKMRAGLFKPNCALVNLDLLIRLGFITPENEPDYMKILTRLHSQFDYQSW